MVQKSAHESEQILSALSHEALITLGNISKALCNDNRSELRSQLPEAIQSAEKASFILSNIWAYIQDPKSTSLPLDQFTQPGGDTASTDRESRAIRLYFLRLAHQLHKLKQHDYASIISQSLAGTLRTSSQLACQCEFKSGRKNKAKVIAFYNKDDKLLTPFLGKEISPLTDKINRTEFASPLLSVIVPVYNAETYLYQSLSSIANQTHKNLEIIAIDDGSTDDSGNILKNFASKEITKTTIIQNKTSVGPGASRNQGLDMARGDFIGFVDADDWIDEDYFSSLLQFADNQTDIVFAQGYKRIRHDAIEVHWHDESNFKDPASPLYRLYPSSTVWDKIFRKDFLVQNKIFFPELPACVDASFVIQSCHHAKNFSAKTGVMGYNYRFQTEHSVTKKRRASTYPDFVFKAYAHLESNHRYQNNNDSFSDCVLVRKWISLMYTYGILDDNLKPKFLNEIVQLALTSDINHILNLGLISKNINLTEWIRSLGLDRLHKAHADKEADNPNTLAIGIPKIDSTESKGLDQNEYNKQILIAKGTKHIHSKWYIETYPEAASLALEAAEHYFLYGAAKGYNPGKHFDTEFYLKTYPEAKASGLNPLVHYALYGKDAGYKTRPKNKDQRQQISVIRTKLLSLGFTERPLAELTEIATISENPTARAMAARELALWHMRAKTDDAYRIALDWISRARPDAPDEDFRAKLSTVELLCHYHLNDTAAGLAAYDRAAFADEPTPDILLARVNFEQTPERRVDWINQVLGRYGIEPVTLLSDEGQPAYDRLTCAVDLPKVTEKPKVTVLIAAYDAADMLQTALRSLQEQTWTNLEIIVLDDCSPTMDTVQVAEHFAAMDPRIQVVRMAENGGAYVARNQGLDMATGEFVTLHDADDWSHPKKIETQVRFMMENQDVIGCTTQQARAYSDLQVLRWSGTGIFTFTNTSSFCFRREPMRESLGYWDTVRFAADNELIRRMQKIWGKDCVVHIKSGPLSFQRDSDSSIVADDVLGINGQPFGVRRQYVETQQVHHLQSSTLKYTNNRLERPFPVPKIMLFSKFERPDSEHYDVILGSEFRLLGGNSQSNAQELICQKRAGLRSAIFPLYRYDVNNNINRPIQTEVLNEVDNETVHILTYGQHVSCDLLVLRYPPILDEFCKFIPQISPKAIKVIVNQPPMSDYGSGGIRRYQIHKCAENIRRYFGQDATWHPIGPLVREALHTHHAKELVHINLSDQDWHNIIDLNGWDRGPRQRGSQDRLRIGRHSRDHPHKWPGCKEDILAAYPDRVDVDVHVLGGGTTPAGIIGHIPKNWTVHDFGSMHPRDFLREIDIWVYFANPGWVESFGRTIIEAMAVGVPVILPEIYRPLFKDSAIYATPETTLEIARELHADSAAYDRQVKIAKAYARENFSYDMHLKRLQPFLDEPNSKVY